QATFALTFLTREEAIRREFEATAPRTRPMDNVVLTSHTPQEDEFALCAAGLRSPWLGMAIFRRRAAHYDRYLDFRDAPAAEFAEWKATLLWFMRKLTLKYGRPLLLKSPPHTARIRILLELFPKARFVHVHRHPYAVFRSMQHTLRRNGEIHALQHSPGDVDEQILRRYTQMYDAFFADRQLIPEGRFHGLAFDKLARDPVGQVRDTY